MSEYAITQCRSCKRAVIWAVTERGKRIPLDAEPNVKGNVVLSTLGAPENDSPNGPTVYAKVVPPLFSAGQVRYMPHHATCPQGESWRR